MTEKLPRTQMPDRIKIEGTLRFSTTVVTYLNYLMIDLVDNDRADNTG